jgi:hypothetical protein
VLIRDTPGDGDPHNNPVIVPGVAAGHTAPQDRPPFPRPCPWVDPLLADCVDGPLDS